MDGCSMNDSTCDLYVGRCTLPADHDGPCSDANYVIQAWNGKRWAKVRGTEGGPWRKDAALRMAARREALPRRTSSTEGMPHRVLDATTQEVIEHDA
jgi:hypothetical protein